jgi:hypothetical protein
MAEKLCGQKSAERPNCLFGNKNGAEIRTRTFPVMALCFGLAAWLSPHGGHYLPMYGWSDHRTPARDTFATSIKPMQFLQAIDQQDYPLLPSQRS